MSSAPKRNSTMRAGVTRTSTMGGTTTLQKGGKKGPAATDKKKVAVQSGGQDDAVAQDKQLEQQLYRTLSMGRKRAKRAAAKTAEKAQSAAAAAPLERKKDLALEDMTFEVDDPEWDREMEARKRRHKEDMIDENVAEEGGMGKVPWNPWFTRLGRMNAYSPVEVMDYYWIRHSTGLSYAYLVVCTLMFILFIGLAYQKWQDASVQMTAFTKQPSLTSNNDQGTLAALNGFSFVPSQTNGTLFGIVRTPAAYVKLEWSLCTDTIYRGITPNDSVTGFFTDGTAFFYNTSCTTLETQACQYGDCLPTAQTLRYPSMANQRQYVRFRALRCRNETLSLGQIVSGIRCRNTSVIESEMDGASFVFQGQSVDNIPSIGSKYGVEYTAYRKFYYRAGSSEQAEFNMELRKIVENPRFIIDGTNDGITAFGHVSSSVRPRDTLSDDVVFFTAMFTIGSPKKEITLKPANILQTIASVCAVCTVLYTLGAGVRAFNRWDFYRNGKFELAELPTDYMENLFDSTRDLELPGYRDLLKSKLENEKKDTEVTLDDIKRKIVDLRRGLGPLIGLAAQQAKTRKKRA